MGAVISTSGLVKRFGRTLALDDLELTVEAGQVHGFLGPNGSGKSTTIRILLGLARQNAGRAAVLGHDPWSDAAALHRRIAYVPGDVSLWPNLTGGEAIDVVSRLRGGAGDRARYAERRQRLIEAFELDPRKKGRAYSKGNRQKVALVAAFATPADLYILDEPTSGLDPLMERIFQREIARVRDEGATVLLSSHILSEVERLADRVSIIRAGRIVESGTLAQLRHLTRTEVSFDDAGLPDAALSSLPGTHDLRRAQGRISFHLDSDAVTAALPALERLGVTGLVITPASLEELFLRHYGDRIADDAPGRTRRAGEGPPAENPRRAGGRRDARGGEGPAS